MYFGPLVNYSAISAATTTAKPEEDWEKELMAELDDFDIVKTGTDEWEQQISDLLDSEVLPDDGVPTPSDKSDKDGDKK